ncbi:MAG TPA: cobalamin-binding protein [Nitrososphaerales archaeon]|nr:cobalamin-binding protein [Nitrososphaerales archaeon]
MTKAQRIVTMLPSATEIVCLLELEQNLVGVTHECDYPESVRSKPVVIKPVFETKDMDSKSIDDSVLSYVTSGKSIYNVDEDLLQQLSPDLVVTQELCDVCATPLSVVYSAISKLKTKPEIVSLSPHTLEDVLEDIVRLGEITGRASKAKSIIEVLEHRIKLVKDICSKSNNAWNTTVFCAEWLDPIYNSGHWMPELVQYAGGVEVLGRLGEPSTSVSFESVVEKDPEVILFAVCGYCVERTIKELPQILKAREKEWNNLRAVRGGRVYVLDGPSYYNRSGPRLVTGLEILAGILHPEVFSYTFPNDSVYSLTEKKFIDDSSHLLGIMSQK